MAFCSAQGDSKIISILIIDVFRLQGKGWMQVPTDLRVAFQVEEGQMHQLPLGVPRALPLGKHLSSHNSQRPPAAQQVPCVVYTMSLRLGSGSLPASM